MHGFRHYATSEMENNGVNAAVSSIILGHSQGTVHDTYFHKQIGSLKAAVGSAEWERILAAKS